MRASDPREARSRFDWVIIDTPPVTLLPDANLLAACVDGVLLVVRAGKAPFQLVKRTVDTLGHDRILGVVMNAVDYRARPQRRRLLRVLRLRLLRRCEASERPWRRD